MYIRSESRELLFRDFIPQAQFVATDQDLSRNIELVRDEDDLDEFVGAAFSIDATINFTIKHYIHSDPDLYTVYMPRSVDAHQAFDYLYEIIKYLNIPKKSIKWARAKDDPDLQL